MVAQSFSGAVYSTVPLLVAICTFTAYIALGNSLDVATALTSLALFDILRFPLFMLPNVLNNLVEAKISGKLLVKRNADLFYLFISAVERVQSFLLEVEKQPVPTAPLDTTGVVIHQGTFVWERSSKAAKNLAKAATNAASLTTTQKLTNLKESFEAYVTSSKHWWFGDSNGANSRSVASHGDIQLSPRGRNSNPLHYNSSSNLGQFNAEPVTPYTALFPQPPLPTGPELNALDDEQFNELIVRAQLYEAEAHIEELEEVLTRSLHPTAHNAELNKPPHEDDNNDNHGPLLKNANSNEEASLIRISSQVSRVSDRNSTSAPVTIATGGERLLTLSRFNFAMQPGDLIAVVGQVGAGKSSIIGAILGDMKVCVQ